MALQTGVGEDQTCRGDKVMVAEELTDNGFHTRQKTKRSDFRDSSLVQDLSTLNPRSVCTATTVVVVL